jgi:hypothetical protein
MTSGHNSREPTRVESPKGPVASRSHGTLIGLVGARLVAVHDSWSAPSRPNEMDGGIGVGAECVLSIPRRFAIWESEFRRLALPNRFGRLAHGQEIVA